jgi:repressor LexA
MQTQKLSCDVVFEYVRDYIAVHSYPPSAREIAADCQLSVSTVLYNLDKLEAWGWIIRKPGVARSIRILRKSET